FHVGDFFWAFIHQNHHEFNLGVIGGDGIGNRLQHHGLTGLGRRDDEAALAFTNRCNQIDQAWAHIFRIVIVFQAQTLLRIQRRQLVEFHTLWILNRLLTIDQIQVDQSVEFLTVAAAPAATTTIASTATTTAAASTAALVVLALLVVVIILRGTNLTTDCVALAQAKTLDHGHGNIDVIWTGQVAGGPNKSVVI